MPAPESFFLKCARWTAFGSAASVLLSIAACQILLALSFACLLLSGARLRLPRALVWPLGLFLLGTLVALFFSGDPAAGLPQVKKFFVFLELLVVFSTFDDLVWTRRLFQCWAAIGALIGLMGIVQFAVKLQHARALGLNFYDYYVPARITGFMSHWMTFSGEQMIVLLALAAFLYYAPEALHRRWLWLACAVLVALAVVLGFTRSVWVAGGAGVLYLTWFWRRAVALAAPAVALVAVLLVPGARERLTSLVHPGRVDSNQFRIVTDRTGLNMIRRHPWLGLGPEEPRIQFSRYIPADIPRPLPEGSYIHLHNIYLEYAAERGIPTALVLVWFLIRIVYDCAVTLRRLPAGPSDRRFALHAGIAVVLAVMLEGLFEYNLGDSEILTLFLAVAACAYVAVEHAVPRADHATL